MVRIRLQRKFKQKHLNGFHIVASDSRVKRDGKFLDKIGTYIMKQSGERVLYVKKNLLLKYLKNGAQLNKSVMKILRPYMSIL